MKHIAITMMGLLAATAASTAHAATVHVKATGTVDYNAFINGPMHGIPSGTPAAMTFDIDSDVFVNNAVHPTRGYPITPGTFSLTVGSTTVGFADPLPSGQTAYFVIRNNDPAVDGFFISTNIDYPFGIPMNFSNAQMDFLRTFNTGAMWPSLDVLDAVGSYAFENMSSYEWTFNVGPGTPMEIAYQTISLTVDQPCQGDITGDDSVDVDDLFQVINGWGALSGPADVDGSGLVDIDDLFQVINSWGTCP